MNLWLILSIAFLYQYGLVQIAIKKIGAIEGSRTRKLVWQYFFAALLALSTAIILGKLEINRLTAIIAGLGALNAFACYCGWRAYDISLSRTAMMASGDDLIAIMLGHALLGELAILTPVLTAGIVISIGSAIIFAKLAAGKGEQSVKGLMWWVLGYSLIWGVALFSFRAFSLQRVTLLSYIATYYFGSWLGAVFIRHFVMGASEAGPPLTRQQRLKVLLLAGFIWTSLMLVYWMRQIAPITIIQPVQLVAEMSIPAILGLTLFQERKKISRLEIAVILAGIIGVCFIAVNFKV